MKKLLLLLMCVLTAVGMRAATTYNMSSSYGTGTLVIDDATGVATVTVTSGTQGHVFGEWFKNLSTASTPTEQAVIDAMNGITKMVYASESYFSSADFNDVLNSFPTVTTVDASGIILTSTGNDVTIKNLDHVKTIILDEITWNSELPSYLCHTLTIDNCGALTSISMQDATLGSTASTSEYQLVVTNNDKLTNIDLSGTSIGSGTHTNLDFSGNTSLTTLDLSEVTFNCSYDQQTNVKDANINLTNTNLSTLLLPEGITTASNVSGNIPTLKATYSNSNRLLHIADSTDPFTYWYLNTDTDTNGNPIAIKNAVITIDMSNLTAGELSSVLASMQKSGVTYNKVKIVGNITESDIAALGSVNAHTLDLSDAVLKKNGQNDPSLIESGFTNNTVKFLILPDGMTRDDVYETEIIETPESWREITKTSDDYKESEGIVNATSLACFTGLYSAVSFKPETSGYSMTSYTKVAGTLSAAVAATEYSTDGTLSRNGRKMVAPNADGLGGNSVTLSGNLNGYDMCRNYDATSSTSSLIDAEGHVKFNKDYADESLSADDRVAAGTETVYGTFTACNPFKVIDMEGAVYTKSNDFCLSQLGLIGNVTNKVVIPTDPSINELPSYFCYVNGANFKQLCIPGNIQIIRTHVAASLDHVWTTEAPGDFDATVYDNGVAMPFGEKIYYGYVPSTVTDKLVSNDSGTPAVGTYTISSNVKLIESNAFANTQPHVSDVYVLAVNAPECHVDAFNYGMYVGYSGYGVSPDAEQGIVTRDKFKNGGNHWITMLHFPRDCGTPDVQRYTDPTREYSIATGLTDGKGATIYFPNYGEFLRAYLQGTTGYTWNAWKKDRDTNNAIYTPTYQANQAWNETLQSLCNDAFTNNPKKAENPYTSFYDVTAEGNLTQPAGLEYYYYIYWNERELSSVAPSDGNLYPRADLDYIYDVATNGDYYYNTATGEYEEWTSAAGDVTRYNRRTTQVETGEYTTDCDDAQYVRDENYVENAAGKFVRTMTIVPNGSQYVQDYEWVEAKNGLYSHQPIMADDGKYFKKQDYEKDDNGNWVFVYGAWREWEGGDNVSTWGITPEPQRYSIVTKWAEWNNDWGQQRYNFSDNYVLYNDDYLNITRYNKEYKQNYREPNSTDAADEPRYDITWGDYATFVDGTDYGTYGTDYLRYNVEYSYRLFDSSIDDASAQRYCPLYETVEVLQVTKKNDYRGWHQFVLTGYSANTNIPVTQHRSYLTDDDWWTICLPYDLNYNEAMLFYGDLKKTSVTINGETKLVPRGEYDDTKKPYISLLTSVTRDVKDLTITLNFSKNLMEHLATKNTETGEWEISETVAPGTEPTSTDIVLHAGVPYLIRPCFPAGGERQFDIYGRDQATNQAVEVNQELSDWRVAVTDDQYPGLYEKLMNAENLDGRVLRALQENGLYTVPALIYNKDGKVSSLATKEVNVLPSKTQKVKINSEEIELPISSEYDYTFVGALFKSVLPPYTYFLGWYNKARFFYNDRAGYVGDENSGNSEFYQEYNWNNGTGIIAPNLLKSGVKTKVGDEEYTIGAGGLATYSTVVLPYNLGKGSHDGKVTQASGQGSSLKPARWVINTLANDWFGGATETPQHTYNSNAVNLIFGVEMMKEFEKPTGIEEAVTDEVKHDAKAGIKIYTLNGQYVGNSPEKLSKGIYIQNGKKVVVK